MRIARRATTPTGGEVPDRTSGLRASLPSLTGVEEDVTMTLERMEGTA
jgi:hypothetical protein